MDAISNGAAAAYAWGNSLATSANGYATAKTIGGGVLNFGAVGVTIQYLWVAKSDPIDSDARTIVIILSSINLGLNILCLLLAIGLAFTKVKSPRSAEFAADLEASVADTNALDDPDHPDAVAALKASIKNIGERHEMPKSIQAAADDDARDRRRRRSGRSQREHRNWWQDYWLGCFCKLLLERFGGGSGWFELCAAIL